jgi:hypothetical protein
MVQIYAKRMRCFASIRDINSMQDKRLAKEFRAWKKSTSTVAPFVFALPLNWVPSLPRDCSSDSPVPGLSNTTQVRHVLDQPVAVDPMLMLIPEKVESVNSIMEDELSRPALGPAYYQCKSSRRAATHRDCTDISINSTTEKEGTIPIDRLGSFDLTECHGIENCFVATQQTNNNSQQNIYLSLDTITLTCD